MPGLVTADSIMPLDSLELLVIVDNETDTLSSIDAGIPQIPEMVQHAARIPPSRRHEGHACTTVFDHLCCGCHGFSVLLSGRIGGETRGVLFDVGPYGDLWLDNARRLAVDLAAIELLFLSHWHWDHSGGLPEVIAAIAAARRQAGRSPPRVDVHPDRPDQRGIQLPDGEIIMLPREPDFADLEAAGGIVTRHAGPQVLAAGYYYASGAIPRTTEYETGLAGHYSFYGERGEPDPQIMDERFIAARVRGRGLTVLSACSHAGIINACLAAREMFAEDEIDLVLGGYHLAGAAMETRIEATVRDLDSRIGPRIVAPGHCTGWRAKAALANRFAPGRFAPSVVGSCYRLQAR
ncbi:MAG: MBL fold metallo-hydrolase [Pseudomonadota bacterium]|nr:MBL fold metallo-hydrolase [Pseudomonadota bacterium]